jgi:hypothetical protein
VSSPTPRSINSYLRRLRSRPKHHHNDLGGRERSALYVKRCYKRCYPLAAQSFECFNESFSCRLGAAVIAEPLKDQWFAQEQRTHARQRGLTKAVEQDTFQLYTDAAALRRDSASVISRRRWSSGLVADHQGLGQGVRH